MSRSGRSMDRIVFECNAGHRRSIYSYVVGQYDPETWANLRLPCGQCLTADAKRLLGKLRTPRLVTWCVVRHPVGQATLTAEQTATALSPRGN